MGITLIGAMLASVLIASASPAAAIRPAPEPIPPCFVLEPGGEPIAIPCPVPEPCPIFSEPSLEPGQPVPVPIVCPVPLPCPIAEPLPVVGEPGLISPPYCPPPCPAFPQPGLPECPVFGPQLFVNPEVVFAGESVEVTATDCPTPPFIGADYRVEFIIFSEMGNFSATATSAGAFEPQTVSIPIPPDAPSGPYVALAVCIGNELGGEFVAFEYQGVEFFVEGGTNVVYCAGLPVTVFLEFGDVPTPGDDVILGTEGNDRINARGGNDTICGLGGADIIFGSGGDDVMFGGLGNDRLFGGVGNDVVFGEFGADILTGGSGNDLIVGGAGSDSMRGQAGNDLLVGEAGTDRMHGGTGLDECIDSGFNLFRSCERLLEQPMPIPLSMKNRLF